MSRPKDWTKKEEDTLRKLHHEGATARDISRALGKTIKAIEVKKLRLDLDNHSRETMRTDLGESSGEVSFIAHGIRTEDELIKAAHVDLTKWKVVRCIINKWEVVMREPATTLGGAGKDALLSYEPYIVKSAAGSLNDFIIKSVVSVNSVIYSKLDIFNVD